MTDDVVEKSSSEIAPGLPPPEVTTLSREISAFINDVESISDGFMVAMIMAAQTVYKQTIERLETFERKYCEVTKEGERRSVKIPAEHFSEWKSLSKRVLTRKISLINLPRSILVSLVSHYDAYLGRLLRNIYIRIPELLNASDRKLTYEDLVGFDSIESAKEYMIEKEIESVLRGSHVEQFKVMERLFSLPLTKGLESWPCFIEITERRNLFVHTGGMISSQYLSVCASQKCKLDEGATEGSFLSVPQAYFERANDCVFEIGIKLGHVLWRKLFPDEREQADGNLLETTFDLLVSHKYELAVIISNFACTELKTHSSERLKLMLIVNRSLAYKWSGDEKSARHSMKGIDWSAKSDEFKLANALILDDWSNASIFMARVGDKTVSKSDYRKWPLFKEWRKREEFKSVYYEIFNEKFDQPVEVNTDNNHSMLNDDNQLNEMGKGDVPNCLVPPGSLVV